MGDTNSAQAINDYWGRDGLAQAILDALATSGKNLDALTIDDLAPTDQFHGGGKAATVRLAHLAALSPGMRVLDVGGGLGGPARTLAVEFGCHVTVIDLTESYVQAAAMLTARLGLGDRVTHHIGNALELPFDPGAFDVVWTQNSGMNIADKERLYVGFHRVLRPGGRLALQEPMAGPVQPIIFPLMWARDATTNFLRTPSEMRALIEAAGFRAHAWNARRRSQGWRQVLPSRRTASFPSSWATRWLRSATLATATVRRTARSRCKQSLTGCKGCTAGTPGRLGFKAACPDVPLDEARPNNRLQPTAYSVRSCVASASGSG